MSMNWLAKVRIAFIAFGFVVIILSSYNVNAFVYRHAIDKLDVPLVKEQHSVNSDRNNERDVSREVINHVHHQHQQTIGNVHILTNIDIANLITILNVSAASGGQSTDATTIPGKWRKNAISLINDFIKRKLTTVPNEC